MFAFGAAACSGGGKGSGSVSIRCSGGEAFCLVACDLVCSQTGCAVTEIAENQVLHFVFSSTIMPSSVNGASVSIRTPSGVAADGELLIQDREMRFVPRVRTIGGVSTFGFLRNESYIITIADNELGQGIRSVSGDGLVRQFSCTVLVSRGIQDADQQAPVPELVSPADPAQTPTTPTVVMRFSELIDTTAIAGPVTASSPINFVLRGTSTLGGALVCDNDQQGIAIEGIAQTSVEQVGDRFVTVYTFTPPVQLPGEHCLTAYVTADVRDLSGRSAEPTSFEMITVPGVSQPITITESFSGTAKQDLTTSSSPWSAGARPGLIGEDGRHGSFDPSLGTQISGAVYEWNVDQLGGFVIPANRSLTGQQYNVTDGKFYFSDFVLPAGTTVRFKGSVPPQIWVRGRVEIGGTLDVSAADLPFWTPTTGLAAGQRVQDFNARGVVVPPLTVATTHQTGQAASPGGAGGGRGGKGADECFLFGTGDVTQGGVHVYYGQDGQDVRLAAGHAYTADAVGTGGKGSKLFPIAGVPVTYPTNQCLGVIYRAQYAPGGSGGGFAGTGGTSTNTPFGTPGVLQFGPIEPGGKLLQAMASLPGGSTSLNHFTIGGSGGGGGGSHMFGLQNPAGQDVYMAGSAGSGGGGALALRAGGDVSFTASASLLSKGGTCVKITGDDKNTPTADANWGVSCPGGGGSGGSFLLQAGGMLTFQGQVDVRGAVGSTVGSIAIAAINMTQSAGTGSPGWYRLESGGGSPTFSGTGQPAFTTDNVGPLTDRDSVTGCSSTWYTSSQVFPPQWLRYELDVDLDGDGTVDITYTDSGAPGTQRANDPAGPVRIQFQGAMLSQAGVPQTGTIGQWRDGIGSGAGPGISLDSVNGFRFNMTFNTLTQPNLVVRALRVFAQT